MGISAVDTMGGASCNSIADALVTSGPLLCHQRVHPAEENGLHFKALSPGQQLQYLTPNMEAFTHNIIIVLWHSIDRSESPVIVMSQRVMI